MPYAIPAVSRRTFLTASTVAATLAAVPAAAAAVAPAAPLAIASHARAVPTDWAGASVVLSGDYTQRLRQLRSALSGAVGGQIALYLDGADAVLFDVANMDCKPQFRVSDAAILFPATGAASGVAGA